MKPETVVRKVKEDNTIDPLMKKIWLDHFENAPYIPGTRIVKETEPLSEETLEEVKQHLREKTDEELKRTIESLDSLSGLTIVGTKNPETQAYDDKLMVEILGCKEVQDFIINFIRNDPTANVWNGPDKTPEKSFMRNYKNEKVEFNESVMVLDERGREILYNYERGCWLTPQRDDYGYEEVDPPKKWCLKPKYDKE